MNYPAILRALAYIHAGGAAFLLPAMLVAIQSNEEPLFAGLLLSLAVTLSFALLILVACPKPNRGTTSKDGLVVLFFWWASAPVLLSFPFSVAIETPNWLEAIHETVSCLATSGHSVIAFPEGSWPNSLIAYRAVLHLIGALVSMVVAASVFAALNIGGSGVHRNDKFSVGQADFFQSARRLILIAAIFVSTSTMLMSILFVLSGATLGEASALAASVVSTGLVDPFGHQELNSVSKMVAVLGLLVAGMGLAPIIVSRPNLRLGVFGDPEFIVLAGAVAVFFVFSVFYGAPLLDSIVWSVSSITTSGLGEAGIDGSIVPISLLLVPAMIGGSVLSSTGGIKLARLSILLRRGGQEFSRLGYPQSVVSLSFRGRPLNQAAMLGVWVYLIALSFWLFVTALWLSLSGASLSSALKGAVGLLTSSGGLVETAELTFNSGDHLIAVVLIIFGRLEILGLLPALSPSFWRK